jgi:hypothetical protein
VISGAVRTGSVDVAVVVAGAATTDAAAGAGATGLGAGAIVSVLLDIVPITSVPLPSFAKTEPREYEMVAVPGFLGVNTSETTVAFEPVHPGLNITPSNEAVPAAANDGSCVQKFMSEPFEIDLSVRRSVG